MKWFYFIANNGKRHYANTREEAERKRTQVGGGVIYETDKSPGHAANTASQSNRATTVSESLGAPAVAPALEADTSWLRRADELVFGQNKQIPALQIYHPTRSDLHSQSDKRLLRLKDGSLPEIAHYAAALKTILPRNQAILLCCAPGSSPSSNSGVVEMIKRICGGILMDGSLVLRTQTVRQRKSNGARFDDHELAATVSVNAVPLSTPARILLIDDVVTSGQTLRVCAEKLKTAYPSCKISCLALSSTDYESTAVGIADRIEVTSEYEALKPLYAPARQPSATANLVARPSTSPQRANTHAPQRSITQNPAQRRERSSGNTYRKQSASASSSDCFVITAVYEGNREHPNVLRLRRLRDERIVSLPGGHLIIRCYKHIGPILAVLAVKTGLSQPMRIILDYCLQDKGGKR